VTTESAGKAPSIEQEWRPVGVSELEDSAWAALRDQGSTSVIAGPGAGKTEFLAQKAAFLLQTERCAPPQRILAISFKRDSASNLARRVETRMPDFADRFVSMTFDAFTKGLVDRFKAALPATWSMPEGYDVNFFDRRDQQDFLSDLASRVANEHRGAIYAIKSDSFLTDVVGNWPLPGDLAKQPKSPEEFAARNWWHTHYLIPGRPKIDFVMLNRLAEILVRTTPGIRRALHLTYPFVFIDEFQDTTAAQLSFLATAFGNNAIFTAVGDRKQRIMGFAGALQDSFQQYETDFSATPYALSWNFRSSDELVLLQHIIATRLDPSSVKTVSKVEVEDDEVAASLWSYNSEEREAFHIAEWIADDMKRSGRCAQDFALVVRQKASAYEGRLRAAFASQGLRVRNDDARYGVMSLQDLNKHEVTRLIVGLLRLAVEPRGLPHEWHEVNSLVAKICGLDEDDITSRQLAETIAQFTQGLRQWLQKLPIRKEDAREVIGRAADIVTVEELRSYVSAQHRGEKADDVLEALSLRLESVIDDVESWKEAFVAFESTDAVSLLTIHKSKGLEYHTVLFLGLDDDQWWSFRYNATEGTAAFFVGLSRAARRLIFTCTKANARSGNISELYALLDQAGVKETRIE
jgi:superfamily I DNA/RNA helicase